MKTAAVAELKAHLSEYLACVKAGEEIVVTEKGRAIAPLLSIDAGSDSASHMAKLARDGLVRLPTRRLGRSFWSRHRPRDSKGTVLRALLRERENGR